MDKNTKILIAGTGLGGLATAACLLQAGYDVEVYEQASKLGEIGAGIQLSAPAVKVLHNLGLENALKAVSVKPQAFEFRLYNTGEVLHKVPLAKTHEESHGAPYYHVHRSDLHQILANKVLELGPNSVHLNSEATGFTENNHNTFLHLADGRKVKGDILIGADGIKSAIRDQIVGVTPTDFTGQVAWRATVDVKKLPANFMEKIVAIWCGPKKHAVVYYLRSGELLNFVGCVENEKWQNESWTVKADWQELKDDFAGWNDEIQTIIDNIDKDQCYRWSMNNRVPIKNWRTNKAVVMGDAAHPTLPYMASGAFMQLLPKGFDSSAYRSTDATVFSVVEGTGKSEIGDKTFNWGPNDTFVVPSWHYVQHFANDECVLFSYSDRSVQHALGLWRQDRGNR